MEDVLTEFESRFDDMTRAQVCAALQRHGMYDLHKKASESRLARFFNEVNPNQFMDYETHVVECWIRENK